VKLFFSFADWRPLRLTQDRLGGEALAAVTRGS